MGSSSLTRDWTSGLLHSDCGVLATGPPGNSLQSIFFFLIDQCIYLEKYLKFSNFVRVQYDEGIGYVFSFFFLIFLQSIFKHFFFPPQQRNPMPISIHSPFSSARQSPICFVCMDLLILNISHKRNYTVWRLCNWFLPPSMMFSRFIHPITCQSLISLYGQIILHGMNIQYVIYPFISFCVVSTSWLINNAAIDICM